MLALSHKSCDKCGASTFSTEQETSVTCKKCGERLTICRSCKSKGCPKCGGKLESQMDWAAKEGILF